MRLGNGNSAEYAYNAAGERLSTTYGDLTSGVTFYHSANYFYTYGPLYIFIDGGYITLSGSTPVYHYYLKDHLGSNRVVCNASGTVEQANHYYPFGGLFGESTNGNTQKYKYNGKEYDRVHGLDWYDYGARFMSPDVGRFITMDPMAEKYYSTSPYAYCDNNPINAIDPNGKEIRPTLYKKTNVRGHAVGIPYRSSKKYYDAMSQFAKTTYGQLFIGKFLKKGTIQYGVKGTGEYYDHILSIEQFGFPNNDDMFSYMGGNVGFFKPYENNGKLVILLSLDVANQSTEELVVTITHELALHGSQLDNIIKAYNSGGIEAVKSLMKKDPHGKKDHESLYNKDTSSAGVNNYLKTMTELLRSNQQLIERFMDDIFNYNSGK